MCPSYLASAVGATNGAEASASAVGAVSRAEVITLGLRVYVMDVMLVVPTAGVVSMAKVRALGQKVHQLVKVGSQCQNCPFFGNNIRHVSVSHMQRLFKLSKYIEKDPILSFCQFMYNIAT